MGVSARDLTQTLTDPGARWDPRLTHIAWRGDTPVGYLIALGAPGVTRAASAFVSPAWRRRGVTALLGAGLLEGLRGRRLEAGVIDEGNAASLFSVLNPGGQPLGRYARFRKSL